MVDMPGCPGCLRAGRGLTPVSRVRRQDGGWTYHCWTCAPRGSWWASDLKEDDNAKPD